MEYGGKIGEGVQEEDQCMQKDEAALISLQIENRYILGERFQPLSLGERFQPLSLGERFHPLSLGERFHPLSLVNASIP